MTRARMMDSGFGAETHFRWRGTEVSRVEGFTDAVFAFAVTLLVVSLEVPHTFAELLHVVRGFIAFALSFALLILIWYQHYLYFRRYGLQDRTTIILNAVLLFVVLFYIYPLKFLFSLVVDAFTGYSDGAAPIAHGEVPALMYIYSAGFLAVFAIFFLLHCHAWRQRATLGLTAAEELVTRLELSGALIYIAIALLSILIVAVGGPAAAGWAGWCYGLLGPAMSIHGSVGARKLRRLGASR